MAGSVKDGKDVRNEKGSYNFNRGRTDWHGDRKAFGNAKATADIMNQAGFDAIDEFNGSRGDFYKNMFAKCPAGRPGTADEVANVAELLMSLAGAFITGADFLIDGGATASCFYGALRPEQ